MEQRKREAAQLLAAEQAARRAANAKPGLSKSASPPKASSNGKGAPPAPMISAAAPSTKSSSGDVNGKGAPVVTKSKALTGKMKKPVKLGYREQQVRPGRSRFSFTIAHGMRMEGVP